MIRCSECTYLGTVKTKSTKTLYSCPWHRTENGTHVYWTKVPKRHPHWCPKCKEEKI